MGVLQFKDNSSIQGEKCLFHFAPLPHSALRYAITILIFSLSKRFLVVKVTSAKSHETRPTSRYNQTGYF